MITLKINTKNGTLTEVSAALVGVTNELDKLKEEGIIEGYSDIEVIINTSGSGIQENIGKV